MSCILACLDGRRSGCWTFSRVVRIEEGERLLLSKRLCTHVALKSLCSPQPQDVCG